MGNFFVNIYVFLAQKRTLFLSLVLVLFCSAVFVASQLKLEEDITKMMPTNSKIAQLNEIFKDSKFMDKLVITVSLEDTSITNTDLLIAYTNTFVDSVKAQLDSTYINEITYQFPDNIIQKVYGTFYDNIPFFLNEYDYLTIDSMLTQERVARTMKKNYKTLVSPVSMMLKKFIVKDPIGITPIALKKLQELQLDDNYSLINGYIITKDKKHLLLFITSKFPNNDTKNNTKLLAHLTTIIEGTDAHFEHKVSAEYFGAMAVASGNANRIASDIKITVSIAMALLVIFISLFFRKPTIFIYILIPVVFGGIMGIAALFVFKTVVSTVALAIGSVLLGITIDFSLHIITHFKSVNDQKKLLKDVATPILMSCLTTSSAFLCLYFVRSEALNELGLFAAVSVFSSAMFGLLVLPHLLKPFKSKNTKKHNSKSGFLERFASLPFHQNKYLLTLVVFITIGSVFTFPDVKMEDNMMNMNYMSSELTEAEAHLNAINSYTLKTVYIVTSGKTLDEALQKNEKSYHAVLKLKKEKIIKKYASVSNLMISDSLQKIKIDRWNSFWTPEKKEKITNLLLEEGAKLKFKAKAFKPFYELLNKEFKPVPFTAFEELKNNFLSDYISEKNGKTTITTQLKVHPKNLKKVYQRLDKIEDITVVDKQYMTEKLVSVLTEDFNKLVKISLIIVFLILFAAYGRIELALITFIPMALSWFWTLGIMGLLGIKFNIFNIIISTFIFGLGIDYSIFITRGLIQEYKTGEKNINSYKTSILLSVFTTIVGVGVLILAQHPALKSIAALSIIGILSVVFVSFTIQPLLFHYMISSHKEKGNVPMLLPNLIGSLALFFTFLFGAFFMTILGVIFIIPPIKNNKKRKLFYHTILMYISRLVVVVPLNIKKKIINEHHEKLAKPAVIIANHQSHIDIPLILMLHPKIIVLVNDWVYSNHYYGAIVRMADFYPVSGGFEDGLQKMKDKVADGYSVLVYPEGTRSKNCEIQRFHKGAFMLAQELKLDILPIILHGAGHIMTKGDNFIKKGTATIKILPRILFNDTSYGQTGRKKAKEIGKYFRNEFSSLQKELEIPAYWAREIEKNYIYKNPSYPWYVKIKLALEDNYKPLLPLIPEEGMIVDIGCGLGYFPFMLGYTSKKRTILGIDYDEDKIKLATNCVAKTAQISFLSGDATTVEFPMADAIILLDILHYLPKEKQELVIGRCAQKLNEKGVIIIRDADASLEKRTKVTKLTELFSTKLFGFNKTDYELDFVSRDFIIATAKKNKLHVEIIDNTKNTSNITYVLRKEA